MFLLDYIHTRMLKLCDLEVAVWMLLAYICLRTITAFMVNDEIIIYFSEVCKEEKETRGGLIDLAYVLESLSNKSDRINGLPPGGGVYAK